MDYICRVAGVQFPDFPESTSSMANHDFIFPYSPEMENWLRGEGCDVPPARSGSRHPSKQEVLEAVQSQGLGTVDQGETIYVTPPPDAPSVLEEMTRKVKFVEFSDGQAVESPGRPPLSYLVLINCFAWAKLNLDEKKSDTMPRNFPLELFLVHDLTRHCGQLALYPDTGDVPVVVEPESDVGRMATVWLEVVKEQTSWAEFYRRVNSAETG